MDVEQVREKIAELERARDEFQRRAQSQLDNIAGQIAAWREMLEMLEGEGEQDEPAG